ncbi:MAG: KpsF/GutQ family sugar-phosphate isomerase [Myxococcota bacterium]
MNRKAPVPAAAASHRALDIGREVLASEIRALEQVRARLDDTFVRAVETLHACRGQVVLTGIGKPYLIAQKIAASMASTGTPAIALHPVDALHGDLGRIRAGDVVVMLSNSGASSEIVELSRALDAIAVRRIAITCRAESPLARLADIVLDLGPMQEAEPMREAPTSTSIAMQAVGDALTMALVHLRGFTTDDFARLHPGGSIGRRLRTVDAAMRGLDVTAIVKPDATVLAAINEITRQRTGAACVVDAQGVLVGIFTDGDLRRLLARTGDSLHEPVSSHMTRSPTTVRLGDSAEEAYEVLVAKQIDELPVVDDEGRLRGHVDIQDVA